MKKLTYPDKETIEKILSTAVVQQAAKGVFTLQLKYGQKIYDLVFRPNGSKLETEGMMRNCAGERIDGQTTAIVSAAMAWMRAHATTAMCEIDYTFTTHDPNLTQWARAAGPRLKLKPFENKADHDVRRQNAKKAGRKKNQTDVVYRRTFKPADQTTNGQVPKRTKNEVADVLVTTG